MSPVAAPAGSPGSLQSGIDLTAYEPVAAAHAAVSFTDDWETRDRLREIEGLLRRPSHLGLIPRSPLRTTPGPQIPKLFGDARDATPSEPMGVNLRGEEVEKARADEPSSGFFWTALCLMLAFISVGLAWLCWVELS